MNKKLCNTFFEKHLKGFALFFFFLSLKGRFKKDMFPS